MDHELEQLDELNRVDLSAVDTDYPVLPKGAYKWKVAEIKLVPGKKREGTKVLEIKLVLNQEAISTKGRPVHVGFPLTTRIGMSETEKYTLAQRNENLARFQEACLGRKGPFMPLEQYIGCELTASVDINRKDEEQFGERNEVRRFVKKS